MATVIEPDVAPARVSETAVISPPTGAATVPRQRKGWLRRMMPRAQGYYSPMRVEQGTAPGSAAAPETAPMPAAAADAEGTEKPRRWWLRPLVPREYVQRRRRCKDLGCRAGASRGLVAGLSRSLRWKRLSGRLSVSLRGSCASELLDDAAFRVMYVVEAVVLGLALSCFFCCCGCQI